MRGHPRGAARDPPARWAAGDRRRLDARGAVRARRPLRADAALLAAARRTAVGDDQGQRRRSGQRCRPRLPPARRHRHRRRGTRAGGRHLGRCSIYDIAPTLLWAMGAGIPADGDGRVLFEAFDELFATDQLREVDGELDRGWAPTAPGTRTRSRAGSGRSATSRQVRRDADACRRARRLVLERPRAPARERPAAPPAELPLDRARTACSRARCPSTRALRGPRLPPAPRRPRTASTTS